MLMRKRNGQDRYSSDIENTHQRSTTLQKDIGGELARLLEEKRL